MITIQKLHSILKKAGLKHSKTYTTTIRGWYNYSEGYHLSRHYTGESSYAICLSFRDSDHHRPNSDRRRLYFDKAKAALTEAGIIFEHKVDGYEELIIKLDQVAA